VLVAGASTDDPEQQQSLTCPHSVSMAELSPVNSANPLTFENEVPSTAADIACVPRWPTNISEMTVDPYPNRNCMLMGMPSARHLLRSSMHQGAGDVTHY
jgi:hypothetical protein